jgi:acetylornithine/N-succinyldiaminopimelate aminotransferase
VRGKGLLAGFKLASGVNTAMRDRLRESGLLAGVAGDNTVRLAPPLNVSAAEIEQAIEIIDGALESLKQVPVAAAGTSH